MQICTILRIPKNKTYSSHRTHNIESFFESIHCPSFNGRFILIRFCVIRRVGLLPPCLLLYPILFREPGFEYPSYKYKTGSLNHGTIVENPAIRISRDELSNFRFGTIAYVFITWTVDQNMILVLDQQLLLQSGHHSNP